jgi:hypothetical protein
MEGGPSQETPQPQTPPNTAHSFNWVQRAFLWLLRIPLEPEESGAKRKVAAILQWFLLALGVGRDNDAAVAACRMGVSCIVICCFFVCFNGLWSFVRLIFVTLALGGAAYSYLACPSSHRLSLLAALHTLVACLSIIRVIIYGASFTICYNSCIPVNAPYTPTLGTVLFDRNKFDVFNSSLLEKTPTNASINTTETVSLETVNQTHCLKISITPWGHEEGFRFDISETVSQVNISAVLAARRQMLGGMIEGMWDLLGIPHDQTDVVKALNLFEQVLLPAHLFQIEKMAAAASQSNNAPAKGKAEITPGPMTKGQTGESKGEDGGVGAVDEKRNERARGGSPRRKSV